MQNQSPSVDLPALERAELGQFLTPKPVADLMASMFNPGVRAVELLDAGAGAGALTSAFVRCLCADSQKPQRISVTAYELDPNLMDQLHATLAESKTICEVAGISFSSTVFNKDFIAEATSVVRGDLFSSKWPAFNAAIVNPPYRKIRSTSAARLLLRSSGIETSNLYTGFLALITKVLAENAQLVAITPRSFCNGPYFKPFRTNFLEEMSLRRLHVFESRSAAFSNDKVLQENIIVYAVKGRSKPNTVTISTSTGGPDGHLIRRQVPYTDVVSSDDPDQFIHLIAADAQIHARSAMARLATTLPEVGLNVSTGRVVDFRAKAFLRELPNEETVPLIYACHFKGGFVDWPKLKSRKPNAIVDNEITRDVLVPSEVYVLVKRFSAKEERRRIVACIYDPSKIPAKSVGLENHLNYFHSDGRGLRMSLAKGLAAFLNSTVVDQYFRQFSGHTQVNATDLRALKYPSTAKLEGLGRKIEDPAMDQKDLDELVERELF